MPRSGARPHRKPPRLALTPFSVADYGDGADGVHDFIDRNAYPGVASGRSLPVEDFGRKGGATDMQTVRQRLATWRGRQRPVQEGQGLAEYALILVLIAIVAILSLIFLGGTLSMMISNVGTSV
jgi:Flp pilus assembly pilin Flp